MNPAVHGTELIVLLIAFVVVLIPTLVCAVIYVKGDFE
jgi:hypothetical protein